MQKVQPVAFHPSMVEIVEIERDDAPKNLIHFSGQTMKARYPAPVKFSDAGIIDSISTTFLLSDKRADIPVQVHMADLECQCIIQSRLYHRSSLILRANDIVMV